MTKKLNMKDAALTWCDRGYAVIPIKLTTDENGDLIKEPHIKWKNGPINYQVTKPSRLEVESWWTQWPDALIAVVGGYDGLVCFDIDDPELAKRLLPKFVKHTRVEQSSKSGKIHIWLKERKHSKGGTLVPKVADLKGNKMYFLVAPSNHYKLVNEKVTEPMMVPNYDTAREYCEGILRGEGYEPKKLREPVENPDDKDLQLKNKDGRNNNATEIAGFLRGKGLSTRQVREHVELLNNGKYPVNVDPLAEIDIENLFTQVPTWEQGKETQYKDKLANLQPTTSQDPRGEDELEVEGILAMTTKELLEKYENYHRQSITHS